MAVAKRRTEVVAASLLDSWTDSDTAMQVVGSSLGVFGTGLLDPTRVLSDETPLRNALFDILLSLVEGGALEMRPTDDARYAFRLRADIAVAGLSSEDSTSIDLSAPSPYAAELTQARAERDDALGRADFAEALAAERERLLRLAGVRSPSEPTAVSRRLPPETRDELSTLDSRDESLLDALYGNDSMPAAPEAAHAPAASEVPPAKRTRKTKSAKSPKSPKEAKPEPRESREVVYLPSPAAAAEPDAEVEERAREAASAAAGAPHRKWSGYAIDTARPHLSSVERLVDEG